MNEKPIKLERAYEISIERHKRMNKALDIARRYGQCESKHHKAWVIDQMVRALLAEYYEDWVKDYQGGVDGPYTFEWYEGMAP